MEKVTTEQRTKIVEFYFKFHRSIILTQRAWTPNNFVKFRNLLAITFSWFYASRLFFCSYLPRSVYTSISPIQFSSSRTTSVQKFEGCSQSYCPLLWKMLSKEPVSAKLKMEDIQTTSFFINKANLSPFCKFYFGIKIIINY